MRSFILALTFFIALVSISCTHAATLRSDDLWLRQSVPGAENGAGFGSLRNVGDEDIVIVAAHSNAAADVEMHRHIHQNGQLAMEQLEALAIPAGEAIRLQPGGYHLMFMQLHQPLQPGQEYQVTLQLNTGQQVEFKVPVKPLLN